MFLIKLNPGGVKISRNNNEPNTFKNANRNTVHCAKVCYLTRFESETQTQSKQFSLSDFNYYFYDLSKECEDRQVRILFLIVKSSWRMLVFICL